MTLEESYEIETGEGFEDYFASSLANSGFKIYTTPRSHDGGCDLIASIAGSTILCQVKQVRSNKVLSNGVEQILDARYRFESADRLVLITTARSVTKSQQELARKASVIVICGEAIENYGAFLARHL
jgi:HJR/Mrr/RecB family endonuclease